MPTPTLYLVRHGEATEGDEHSDPALTERGRRQATAVGAALSDVNPDALLHSSRRRATETALIIATMIDGVSAEHSDAAEDRTPIPHDWSMVPVQYHEFLRSVPGDDADPGARKLNDAVSALSIVGEHDRTVVMVTHNFVIGWIVRGVMDAPWWRWIGLDQDNGAISVVRWSDARPPQLLSFNQNGHFAAI